MKGSIEKRGKNSYRLVVFKGYDLYRKPMRHTNATLLISQNIDIAVVTARLGHAQITTTLNFHVHPVISHNKIAGNILEHLLIPQKNIPKE